MIKRYLCGLLIVGLLLCQPIRLVAEEALPTTDSSTQETASEEEPDDTEESSGDAEGATEPPQKEDGDSEDPADEPQEPSDQSHPEDEDETDSSQEEGSDEESTESNDTAEPSDDAEGATEPPQKEDGDSEDPADEPQEPSDQSHPEDESETDSSQEEASQEKEEPVTQLPDHLLLSEVMIGSEVNPEKDSWVEIYNPTDQAIELADWQIRGVTKGGRWIDIIKEPQTISPQGVFVLSYYTNSRYSALEVRPDMTKDSIYFTEGEIEIELKSPQDEVIDQMTADHQAADEFRSYERNADDEWERATEQVNLKEGLLKTFATPGDSRLGGEGVPEEAPPEEEETAPPDDEPPPPPEPTPPPPVEFSYPSYELISEIMMNPEGSDAEGEWVELHNNTNGPIDITGWYLDDAEGNSAPYWIRDKTVLMPDEYKVFSAPDLKLSLKNSEDEVRLLDPNQEAKEVIRYSGAKENWTYARKTDGRFDWLETISPGSENQFPPPPKTYCPDTVVIQNVLPNPEGKDGGSETITLKNNLDERLELDRWSLVNKKGKPYLLKEMALGSYEKKTIDPSAIGLTLVNKADQLSLLDPAGNLIDRLNWTDAQSGEVIFRPDYFQDGMGARVLAVIDGDTLTVEIDNEPFKVRLIGVDTPETVHPFQEEEEFGQEASDYLKTMLAGQTVVLEFDENEMDTYNRLLAYVYLRGIFINAEIVKNGYGRAYTDYPFRYLNEFIQYEQEAKEKKVGLWIYETADSIPEGQDNHPDPNDENSIENIVKSVNNENIENNEENEDEPLEEEVVCPNEGLQIDAIMPNAQKGESMEWIRLINPTDQKICLNGWQIDDELAKGSKPFQIKGGAIAAGGVRTFRKNETGLALNNSNDCANLLNPLKEVADRICYEKTHKNEVFTHEGGDWQPKPKSRSSKTSKTSRRTTVRQNAENYQWELKNETLNGHIAFVYEEGEILYLENHNQTIPVSYAGSPVNMAMAKELIDIRKPVTLHVRASEFKKQLIGLEQEKTDKPPAGKEYPTELNYVLALIMVSGGWYGFRKLFDKPFKKRTIIS